MLVPRREWLDKRQPDLMKILLPYGACSRVKGIVRRSVVEFQLETVIKKFDHIFIRGLVSWFYRPSPQMRPHRLVDRNVNKLRFRPWLSN